MSTATSKKLAAAKRNRQLVRFYRPFERGWVNGYVLDIGPRFFLLAFVSDGIRFDGFQCFRTGDVRRLRVPAPHSEFVEAALKLRGGNLPKRPRVKVSSLEDLLNSASEVYHRVTIHRERIDPHVCEIGKVVEVRNGVVQLLEIDPDAVWDKDPTSYRLSEITRVDFGGDFEGALKLVGGSAKRR